VKDSKTISDEFIMSGFVTLNEGDGIIAAGAILPHQGPLG